MKLTKPTWLPAIETSSGKHIADLGDRVGSHMLDVLFSAVLQISLLLIFMKKELADLLRDMLALRASDDTYLLEVLKLMRQFNIVDLTLVVLCAWLLGGIIEILLTLRFGGSLGKLINRLEVLDAATGKRPGVKQIAGRWLGLGWAAPVSAYIPSLQIIPFFGYFIAWFDPQRRALHDRVSGTYVVKVSKRYTE